MADTQTQPEDMRPGSAIEAHARLNRMHSEILRLDLARNILELDLYGYTLLENAQPPEFFRALRKTILKLGREDLQDNRRIPLAGKDGDRQRRGMECRRYCGTTAAGERATRPNVGFHKRENGERATKRPT